MYYAIEGRTLSVNDKKALIGLNTGFVVEISIPSRTYLADDSNLYAGKVNQLFVVEKIIDQDIKLFGFFHKADREMFIELLNIDRIGISLAMNILSVYSSDQIKNAALDSNIQKFKKLPGVGNRTAENIVKHISKIFGAIPKFPTYIDTLLSKTGLSRQEIGKYALAWERASGIGFQDAKILKLLLRYITDGVKFGEHHGSIFMRLMSDLTKL